MTSSAFRSVSYKSRFHNAILSATGHEISAKMMADWRVLIIITIILIIIMMMYFNGPPSLSGLQHISVTNLIHSVLSLNVKLVLSFTPKNHWIVLLPSSVCVCCAFTGNTVMPGHHFHIDNC